MSSLPKPAPALLALLLLGLTACGDGPDADATGTAGQDGGTTAPADPEPAAPKPSVEPRDSATSTPPITVLPSSRGTAPRPTRQGEPWEFDAASNHHFDPRPGHGHWHAGPPPPESTRQGVPAGATTPTVLTPSARPAGEPWEYDAATGRHYDPRPGHQHWHPGQPPPVGSDTRPGP